MLDQEQLVKYLEQQGNVISEDPNSIFRPREPINTNPAIIFTLFNNINLINDQNVITGLLMNISSFIIPGISLEVVNQTWLDLINAMHHVTFYADIFGIMEILRSLIVLCGSINPIFLDFLVDPNVPLDTIRSYALETLYDYLPPQYLTLDDGRKRFLAELLIKSLLIGDIYHQSFMIQLLFALHLNSEQICSLSELPDAFWTVIFNISNEPDDFSDLLIPANKLKKQTPSFFEQENAIISKALSDLESSIDDSNVHIPMMLNFFKIFHLFPTVYILKFLDLAYITFLKFSEHEWSDIKSISHLMYECILDAKFTNEQYKAIYDFSLRLPNTCSKFFIFVHFLEIFETFENFAHPFITFMCMEWMGSETFNPFIYCFCMSQVFDHLSEETDLFETIILPSIFTYIEAPNDPLLNYEALKALKHFYREDLIQADKFVNTLLEKVTTAHRHSLKYFFKLILEIEKHTRNDSNEDEGEEEEEEEEYNANRLVHEKLNKFVRSNFFSANIDPIFCGHLCDALVYFIDDDEENEFVTKCLFVCQRLMSSQIASQPEIYVQVTSLFLELFRSKKKNLDDQLFQLFQPLYKQLLTIVLSCDFTSPNTEYSKSIGNVAFLLSFIKCEITNDHFSFEFPLIIITNLLNASSPDLIQFGLSITRRFIPFYLPTEANQIDLGFIEILNRCVYHCSMTTNIYIVNSAYRVFCKYLKKCDPQHLSSIWTLFEAMKNIGFQERYKILKGQSVTRLNTKKTHFNFFQFLSLMVQSGCQLTSMEMFTLIRWIENAPISFLSDVLNSMSTVIKSGQIVRDGNLYDPLWRTLNTKLVELNPTFAKNPNTVISILNTICEFLTFVNLNDLGNFNCSSLLFRLTNAWKADASGKKEKNFDPVELLGPIILRIYSLTNYILDFNWTILNQIGDSMIERSYDWNYSQMIENIISLQKKFGTLHLFTNTCTEVLFNFYVSKKTPGFTRKLVSEMKHALKDLYNHDSRVVDYLIGVYNNSSEFVELINEVFEIEHDPSQFVDLN